MNSREYTPEETAANRRTWVAALRSGEFEQTQGTLKSDESGSHCCLGVAGELCATAGVISTWRRSLNDDPEGYQSWYFGSKDGTSSSTELTFEMTKWLGLHNGTGALKEPVQYFDVDDDPKAAWSLIELNDQAGYTFDQIADVIESGNLQLAGLFEPCDFGGQYDHWVRAAALLAGGETND